MKNKVLDMIYSALKIMPRLSAVGVIIFIIVGLITGTNTDLMLRIALAVLMMTVAIVLLVSGICMELDIDEDSEEKKTG